MYVDSLQLLFIGFRTTPLVLTIALFGIAMESLLKAETSKGFAADRRAQNSLPVSQYKTHIGFFDSWKFTVMLEQSDYKILIPFEFLIYLIAKKYDSLLSIALTLNY